MFAYCNNNPASMKDNQGRWPEWVEETVKIASAVIVVAAVVATVVTVSAFTAGTGSAAAVYVSSIVLGGALSGINGGIANESQGNSYANGYAGGFVSGSTQSAASRLPGGTIWGGSLGTGCGTAITSVLNNLDPDSATLSNTTICKNSFSSAAKAFATSTMTYMIGDGVGGIDYDTGNVYGAVADKCGGLLPTLTLGFGEAVKAFFGAMDDAMVYLLE